MTETQQTISQWACDTFGEPSSDLRIIVRANEEMAELLKALSADDDHPKAPEECADVAIVLARFAERCGFALFQPWSYSVTDRENNCNVALGINREMAHLMSQLTTFRSHVNLLRCGRIISGLRAICRRLGTTLSAEVRKKMKINRARKWNLTGDGHGYHIKLDAEDFKHV